MGGDDGDREEEAVSRDRLKEASMELSSGVAKEGKGEGRPKGNMEALKLGMERKHLTNRNSR